MSKPQRKNTQSEAELEQLAAEISEATGRQSVVDSEVPQPQGNPLLAHAEVQSPPGPKIKPFNMKNQSNAKNAQKNPATKDHENL